ncbi:sensor histidine kinase [Variovorax sp. RHLX14]|uniref:sensor histidine kinase n=1 Tax=Variovorax sp. RHLX14 TaxID=1259731 RepID=UPI003F44F7BD
MSALAKSRVQKIRILLSHGLITAAFCCFIATALAIAQQASWESRMVYSLSIGLISWFFIDGGRLLFSRKNTNVRWPEGRWAYVLVIAGVVVGFLGGNVIGDAWTHQPAMDFQRFSERKLLSAFIVTLTATVGICFFFYSLGKSRYLLDQIDQARGAASEARLKLLETQIEPHMLFNTLANLRVLITLDPLRAVAMLDHLNNYLRMTLGGSRAQAHPLWAEFARLEDYLELMTVRMGDRLTYELTLPDDLRNVLIPPLLLQPLVENSIRHGLEPKVEGGHVYVRAYRAAARLIITVNDTGVGLEAVPMVEGSGFGLAQVRERLSTVYGDLSRLYLAPGVGVDGGVCATLSLPLSG